MMLKELKLIDEIKFVHPKDVQDGKIQLSENDITTNLPYDSRVGLAFDHHVSETERISTQNCKNLIIDQNARSAAAVVYQYYGGKKVFGDKISGELMAAVDKGDSADFTIDEIVNPSGWVLLHFLMDARTGLGRFHDFRISNYDLMMELIDYCRNHSISEILALPDVKERVDLYFTQQDNFIEQIKRVHRMEGRIIVIDLRGEKTIYCGNRFLVFAMYPDVQLSMHIAWGVQKQNIAVMIGKSIINKTSQVNIGDICLSYGGGGHHNAGTCQLPVETADKIIPEILNKLNE